MQIVSKNFHNGALDEKADINSMGINLGFDSVGLGIFDAFFTSLSMTITNEVYAFIFYFFTNLYLTQL